MISVIIPSFNEKDNIAEAARAVSAALSGEEKELIFVDDGSTDGTWNEITAAAVNPEVRGIRFSRNFGKEAAIRAGLESARGDALAVIDCDLQHPPDVLKEMVQKWREGAGVVVGKKSYRGSESRGHGLFAKIFNGVMSKATGFDMSGASDFILLDRRAADAVLQYGEQGSFFRALAQFIGFDAAEVTYNVAARARGEGKWTFKKLFKYAVKNIASFTDIPLYFSLVCGISDLIAALVLLVLCIIGVPLGAFNAAVITLMILAGLILVSLGVAGFYLSRIYDEIKSRPRYHICARTDDERKI